MPPSPSAPVTGHHSHPLVQSPLRGPPSRQLRIASPPCVAPPLSAPPCRGRAAHQWLTRVRKHSLKRCPRRRHLAHPARCPLRASMRRRASARSRQPRPAPSSPPPRMPPAAQAVRAGGLRGSRVSLVWLSRQRKAPSSRAPRARAYCPRPWRPSALAPCIRKRVHRKYLTPPRVALGWASPRRRGSLARPRCSTPSARRLRSGSASARRLQRTATCASRAPWSPQRPHPSAPPKQAVTACP
mmetsp:Transcript_21696/g.58418  ORF Transcript_21696/g.58418 Transcript_21696/m.58418 type:complete len:242 (+) Transcript_21696:297-1022(+)